MDVLATVAREVDGGALDAPYRSALEGAIRYFSVAAPRHTADEEASLFPRLRNCDDPALERALASLEALERDHDEAEANHAAIEALVRRWLAEGRLSRADTDELRERLARLRTLYERHIAMEDQEVFPAAARVLAREQLEEIGGEMAARRQVPRNPFEGFD